MAKTGRKKSKTKHKVGIKLGIEGGSKGSGPRLTIKPTIRKRRKKKPDQKKPNRKRAVAENVFSKLNLETVSPAGRHIQVGIPGGGGEEDPRIRVVSELGVVGFGPKPEAADLSDRWRRRGAVMLGTIIETDAAPGGLSVELWLSGGAIAGQPTTDHGTGSWLTPDTTVERPPAIRGGA